MLKHGLVAAVLAVLVTQPLVQPCAAQTTWTSNNFEVRVEGTTLTVSADGKPLIDRASLNFDLFEPVAARVVQTTPDSLVLRLAYPPEVKWRRHADSAQTARIVVTPVQNGLRFHSSPSWANHINIETRDLGGHAFGLIERLFPDNRRSPDLRGEVVDVYARGKTDTYAEDHVNAWSAFYMNSRGFASFFDTFARGRYAFAQDGQNEIYHETGELDWYLFYGPTGDRILEGYYDVIGRPKSLPMWALGPVFWRDAFDGKDQILSDVRGFTQHQIPMTALWIDRPYSDGNRNWSEMNFNEKFATPDEWISTIRDRYGIKVMTWVAPMVFSAESDFPGLFPTYKGYFDLTDPKAVSEFARRLNENQYAVGVQGHKMDRGAEVFPNEMRWHDGTPLPKRPNKYVWLYGKTVDDIISEAWGQDHFIFSRAGMHRMQPHVQALWGGDVRTSWAGMSGNQANAMRTGFMGFPVWGTDVGGYVGRGRTPKVLYARWLQWGVWNGFFEIKVDGEGSQGRDRLPWTYDQELLRIFRQACRQRMRLLPYLYSQANTSHKNGVLMKPLAYAYPADTSTYDVWDEYLFGEAFLVAPVFSPEGEREVYLPEGRWHDFHDLSTSYEGGQTINVNPPLDRIPVFVKANAIYVTGDVYAGNAKRWREAAAADRSLTIHAVPGAAGQQHTFDYLDYLDDDQEKPIRLTRTSDQIHLTAEALSLGGTIHVKCPEEPTQVTLNGEDVRYQYESTTGILQLSFDQNKAIDLKVRF